MPDQPYRFKGMPDFVVKEGISPSFASRISSSYFIARLADALSQIPEAKPEHRPEMYEVARSAIRALDACLKTGIAAFDEVMANAPPPPSPEDPVIQKPEAPAPARRPKPADPIPVSQP